jgi:hypothetical protein
MSAMGSRSKWPVKWRAWLDLLVVTVFALSVPLFTAMASVDRPATANKASAMSCHDSAGQDDAGGSPSDRKAALAHVCCFTACIPLAAAVDATVALALPVGEPLPTLLPTRLMPRVIGVDPPPPKT